MLFRSRPCLSPPERRGPGRPAGDSIRPATLFRRSVRYADIEKVEVGRTLVLVGWGIHYSIRGGWVWNLWGRDCVVAHWKHGGVLRIGTDDASNLTRFLEGKIAPQGLHPV